MASVLRSTALGAFCILALGTGSASAETATGEEIRTFISGNTLQGASSGGVFAEYYDPDGTLRGDGYSGTWKIEGDAGCMDYGQGYQCWTGIIKGNANIWFLDGQAQAAGYLFPGNPNEF